ncbi:MAG TPA: FAD-dependent oxidoreductase [Firmicutes bacterium]|nr:FAD-dependent oxidoreductase [Bacillota bacterium]
MERINADVVVVGGGPSGFGAAISAAKEGAHVVLLEEDSQLGGAAVDYGVQGFSPGIICGVHAEIREILAAVDYTYKHTKCEFNSHWYAHACNLIASREPKLQILNHTIGIGVLQQGDQVRGVVAQTRIAGKHTEIEILAPVTIDCTGDGDIAFAAGCKYRYGREASAEFNEPHAPAVADNQVQLCTWMYRSRRIDEQSQYVPDFCYNRDIGFNEYLHWGCQVPCADTVDSEELRKAEQAAWEVMRPNFATLQENGFVVTYMAPRLGIRESRRIVGEVIITENDCASGRRFPDAITSSKRGLDSWEPDRAKIFYGSSAMYDIPLRALLPQGKTGILVAGRCISATHIALSGFRVMPTVTSIGQAAGLAAAMAAQQGCLVQDISVSQLQQRLESAPHNVRWSKHVAPK